MEYALTPGQIDTFPIGFVWYILLLIPVLGTYIFSFAYNTCVKCCCNLKADAPFYEQNSRNAVYSGTPRVNGLPLSLCCGLKEKVHGAASADPEALAASKSEKPAYPLPTKAYISSLKKANGLL